jgi:hypothetical protein
MKEKVPRPGASNEARRAGDGRVPGQECRLSLTTTDPRFLADALPQPNLAPIAHTRIVIGRRYSSIYIEYCPLCGLEHVHGQFPLRGEHSDPLQAYAAPNGHRGSHCGPHGLGRVARYRPPDIADFRD